MELPRLLEAMDQVSNALRCPIDEADTLRQITAAAVDTIPSVEHASISVTDKNGRIQTLAPTDAIAVRADELQYELGEGPCLAAFTEPVAQGEDLADDLRWALYGPRAAALGLGSQIGFQFAAEPYARGALNLYASEPHCLDLETRRLGILFADLVAVALGWSRQNASLHQALDTRSMIGQAIGIVMERYRFDADRAFAFLVRTSQTGNLKLRDVAAGLIEDTTRRAS
ncbi:GAF and ANTAR domain-containing protein [Kribbella sp. NPDC005582]|uniref:GAF and ANTAR domain-containing protein n=1 Tax=Kribbella sp. NPDC005582 TaxID=3156893 RepID=UPI0033BF64CA